MERFNLKYDDRNVSKYGNMEQAIDGEWVRFDDVLKDDGRGGIFIHGEPLGKLLRFIGELKMFTNMSVEEWYKRVDERIVSAASAFVEYVPGMRWKQIPINPIDPRHDKIVKILASTESLNTVLTCLEGEVIAARILAALDR
jgi:hypothetical protein